MKPRQQKIIRERRQYNQWVASQTLEDYALRFTAARARRSTARVGNTALGPIAFLACEAIGVDREHPCCRRGPPEAPPVHQRAPSPLMDG